MIRVLIRHPFLNSSTNEQFALESPTVAQLKTVLKKEASFGVFRAADDYEARDSQGREVPPTQVILEQDARLEFTPVFPDHFESFVRTFYACVAELQSIGENLFDPELITRPDIETLLGIVERHAKITGLCGSLFDDLASEMTLEIATGGVEHHQVAGVAYIVPPSQESLLRNRAGVPFVVAGAAVLGMVASADPATPLCLGEGTSFAFLLLDLLSDIFHGEYRPNESVICEMLNRKYSPVKGGIYWVLLKSNDAASVRDFVEQLDFAESTLRHWLAALEADGIIEKHKQWFGGRAVYSRC